MTTQLSTQRNKDAGLTRWEAPVGRCAWNRRLKLVSGTLLRRYVRFLALVTCLLFGADALAAEPPNVLLIITDEHNFRTLGCYRDQMPREQAEMWGPGCVVETPNLDRIAREGLLCTRAYATAPVCSPCRAAMITGRYPHNTGVPANNLELRDDVPTLAELLARAGYSTSFIGKWHLGGNGKPEWQPKIDGGFQSTSFMFNRGHWKKFELTESGARVAARNANGSPNYNVEAADEESFSTDFLTDRALEFVKSSGDEPFLLVVSYPDPHGPNTVRPPYDHMYDDLRFLPPRTYGINNAMKPDWLPGNAARHPKFRGDQMSRYFGMVKCIDDNVGRIVNALERSGQLDSTIVIMTSDHGDLCYEHDRLNKGNPYEGSARVPLIIRYPKKFSAGQVHPGAVGTVDLTPTILGLAGISSDQGFEGRNRLPAFQATGESADDRITFLRNAGQQARWLAAVDDRYKLIVSTSGRPWLFDAKEDPDELLNFYGRPGSSMTVRRLGQALVDYSRRTGDPFAEHPQIKTSLKDCVEN